MTATPTPGDLSARLLAEAAGLEQLAGKYVPDAREDEGTAHLLREAAAALSALPAGGEPAAELVAAATELRQRQRDYLSGPKGERSEEKGKLVGVAAARVDAALALFTTTPPADADVGAQGEGWPALPWRDINECPDSDDLFWFMRGDTIDGPRPPATDDADYWDWFAPCEAPSSAAPAAGKGVDDVLDLATQYGDHSFGSRNRESWEFDTHGLKQFAAALTRQPVAGDGK